jgi:hypothetical protein
MKYYCENCDDDSCDHFPWEQGENMTNQEKKECVEMFEKREQETICP